LVLTLSSGNRNTGKIAIIYQKSSRNVALSVMFQF
jgi:hypothetical protein